MEKRLQAVAYMRESALLARERLSRAGQILGNTNAEYDYGNGEAYLSDSSHKKDEQNRAGMKAAWSIALRTSLVLLILLFFMMGKNGTDGSIGAMQEKCTGMIRVDYAENLFDFIQEISYTFDYEKINA